MAMVGCTIVFGQGEGLIVKRYSDTCCIINECERYACWLVSQHSKLYFDLNNDGVDDYRIERLWEKYSGFFFRLIANDQKYNEYYPWLLDNPPIRNAVDNRYHWIKYGERIDLIPENAWYWKSDDAVPGSGSTPTGLFYAAFRMPAEGDSGYYYGWMRFLRENEMYPNQCQLVRLTIEESALCTIPNHPLSVGQTRIDGVEEPRVWLLYRPEYLLIRTEGNEVASAAAVDMAGRTVATAESLADGMAKLEMQHCAAGVYVAVVRLKSGKTVSRKFVHWQH